MRTPMMLITTSNSIRVKPRCLRVMVHALQKVEKENRNLRPVRLPDKKTPKDFRDPDPEIPPCGSWPDFGQSLPDQLTPRCSMAWGRIRRPSGWRFLHERPPTTISRSGGDNLCLGPVEVRSPYPPPGLQG